MPFFHVIYTDLRVIPGISPTEPFLDLAHLPLEAVETTYQTYIVTAVAG
jgi:hypothetical protein